MQLVTGIHAMQRTARRWKAAGIKIAFVPTMGFLHAGHVSLIHRARLLAGRKGRVVVSVFVNPSQFGPKEDFTRYPRNLARDRMLCSQAGADLLFAPRSIEMYPESKHRSYSTWISEERLSRSMEGAARPGHFRGVTTVVAKLFNLVLPDFALFGAKDFQQAAVIRRMTRDLNFPVKILVAPTVRERDGLALSSRNAYLSSGERDQAVVLHRILRTARQAVARRPVDARALRARLKKMISAHPAARLDYLEFFDPETLEPVQRAGRGTQMALAIFIGKTRLIDNGRL